MKPTTVAALLGPVLASAWPSSSRMDVRMPAEEEKITYDGFKVFRVATHHDPAEVKNKVASLQAISLNMDDEEHLDLAVAPTDVQAFEELGLETAVMHEDLGADIRAQMEYAEYPGTW